MLATTEPANSNAKPTCHSLFAEQAEVNALLCFYRQFPKVHSAILFIFLHLRLLAKRCRQRSQHGRAIQPLFRFQDRRPSTRVFENSNVRMHKVPHGTQRFLCGRGRARTLATPFSWGVSSLYSSVTCTHENTRVCECAPAIRTRNPGNENNGKTAE